MVLTSAMAELGEALQSITQQEKGTDADWLLYLLAVLLASNLEPVSQAQVVRYLSHYRKIKGMGALPPKGAQAATMPKVE